MPLSRDSRAIKKLKIIRRAEFTVRQRLARVDFEEDVLLPEVEAYLSGKAVLELPEGAIFDLVPAPEDDK